MLDCFDRNAIDQPDNNHYHSVQEALFWVEELPQIRAIAIQSEESQQYYATLFWITIIVTLLVFLLLAAIVVHCVCFR